MGSSLETELDYNLPDEVESKIVLVHSTDAKKKYEFLMRPWSFKNLAHLG
mgnify:CR=1 FL=1